MDAESHWVYERMKLYDLMQQQSGLSNRQYARQLQHDPKWVRKWRQRFQATPEIQVKTFFSQSRAPHTPPRRVTAEIKEIVVQLRRELTEQYHRPAGHKTIQWGLQQWLKTQAAPVNLPRSSSTITHILREAGYILPPKPRWHEPLTLPAPMEEWELDFAEIWLAEGIVFEFLVVVDRGTSRLIYVEGSTGYQAETALLAVARLFILHGLPQRLRFDRDVRLWGAWTRDSYPSPFVRFLRAVGVEPVICPPRRPDKKPFVERCIGTLKHEWLARFSPATLAEAYEVLEQFPDYYNRQRPHQGRACQNRPPDEAFPVLPALPPLPDSLNPDAWLGHEHGRIYRRRINTAGTIQVDRHTYFISSQLAGQPVLVHLDAERQCFWVTHNQRTVKQLPIAGLYQGAMDFASYLRVLQAEARTIAQHHRLLWERTSEPP